MGMLGKILLFLNLLAAAAVAYFATESWAIRQEVAASATRFALVLQGLPLETPPGTAKTEDSVPIMMPVSGGVPVESVRPSLLEDHFRDAPGGANLGNRGSFPATQVEEIREVQTKAQAMMAAGPVGQLELLCGKFTPPPGANQTRLYVPGWLAWLAESYEERALIFELADTPNTNPQQIPTAAQMAVDMFNRRFEAVLNAPNPALAAQEATAIRTATDNLKSAAERTRQALAAYLALINQKPRLPDNDPQLVAARRENDAAREAQAEANRAFREAVRGSGTSASRDEGDRRLRIAHLLLHLDQSADWQRRVALVVGLRTYKEALNDQIERMRSIALSAEQQIVLDQAAFSEEYEALRSLAIDRTVLLIRQQQVTADLKTQKAADLTAVSLRKDQLDSHRASLARYQAEVAEALARQQAVEAALFEVQQRVGNALARNANLERKLEGAEEKKAGTTIPDKGD